MKKCPKCKEDIADGAVKCKHCGADLRNWFARHKVLTGILVIVVLIIIISAASGGKDNGSTPTTASNGSSSSSQTAANKEYKVGEAIQLDNHTLTVNSTNKSFKTGNEYEKPQDSSNTFVTVNITVTNTGDDNSLSVNDFGFKLEDETGTQRDTTFASSVSNPLQSVTLSKGGTTTGNLIFEAKANSKTLKLHYSGGMFGGGEVIVIL